ncbi:HEAT repeat domain-containing protein [Humisphaera borealis]|uniref:HEAT repeat domain-containing protein n=1 Tax=Humisphaera borealis TaxID=2807512 RepID=A0A7M2WZK9_9BACT|nr:HEAT repeat domain-containing protein [Humisphaera borealis]QOV90291.1 HEAT repeat domain-containing protein [Humisphaera borealis]
MIQDLLLLALIRSRNEAADDVLVECLRFGNEAEQLRALDAIIQKKSVRALVGVLALFDRLPETLQLVVLKQIKAFHIAIREGGRSDDAAIRVAAMKLIARGRQGRLAYVLSENLHEANETVSRAAAEAMVALARWVASEAKALQRGIIENPSDINHPAATQQQAYDLLMEQRPEIEAAIARALDVHRGRHSQDLLRGAILLCDSTASRAFQILATPKHGGQTPMVRRLQQAPTSEHVDAFLLGASHGHLRSHFGTAFAHISEAPVLDALLRRTYWLKDNSLQLCIQQVGRGVWWSESDLARDLARRRPEESAKIGEWVCLSGTHEALQDERLEKLRQHAAESATARLRLLRIAARRPRGTSVVLLKNFLTDADERLMRIAAREIIRRRPPDYENLLLQLMTSAPPSVRKVVGRAIGQSGFEHFWNKFDRLPKPIRRQAGSAMLKLLPDAIVRLQKRLSVGPADQRLKALQIVYELGMAESMRDAVVAMCHDADPRLRSKAVMVAGQIPSVTPEMLVDRLLNDTDARVRANTIEVLENKADARFVPVLTERARSATNRERANAIKALFKMRVSTVSNQLFTMLRDDRAEHRISAMWTLRQIGWWQLLGEVGRLAKDDSNIRVRRYALNVLKGVADLSAAASSEAAGRKATGIGVAETPGPAVRRSA